MSSISQHISLGQIHNERTSIIYVVTDIVFSLKQHIPPSGELLSAEVSLVLHRSLGQSKYAVYLPTRRRMYRSSTCVESWRFCPTAFLLRSGEFIPRHPFVIRFSRCNRGCLSPLIPYLGKIQRLTTKNQKNFFSFSKMALLRLLTACCVIPRCLAMVFSLSGVLDRYRQ